MRLARFLGLLLGISYGLGLSLPALAQSAWQSQLSQLPELKADVIGSSPILLNADSAQFRIAVRVPPDHHGYLDKGDEGLLIPLSFTFASLEAQGARVIMLSSPPGERDDTYHATVLRGKGHFLFRVHTEQGTFPTEKPFSATVRYQICNDVTSICYPPRQTDVALHFASLAPPTGRVSGPSQTAQPPVVPLTISERITFLFQQYMQHSFLALGVVFLAGLLATATPCVYPILPITSAILVARGGGSRQCSQWHAMVYFVGMVFFYTLLGLFAAITGSALSKIMANGWVNIGFAIIFAYFGLSMLGLYEFRFLPSLTAKLDTTSGHAKGLWGTLLMGATAGLIASPCVGPVAGAILLQITGQSAGAGAASDTIAGNAILRGLILMTSFGAGLGLPFLALGVASHRLPQSGQWLSRVKFALGLPILYFSYVYYLKGMETVRVPEHVAHAILVGIVAIGVAVFIGAFHPIGEKPSRGLLLRHALGIVLLLVGAHFLYNGLDRSGLLMGSASPSPGVPTTAGSVTSPSSFSEPPAQPQVEVHRNLHWFRNFSQAQERASAKGKPLFVDFYATWCANCKAFEKLTVRDRALNRALQQAVLVKIYDTDAIFRTFQQNPLYPELHGIGGQPFLPLFAIYSPQGTLTWKGQNYKAVRTIIARLEQARH